MDHEVYRCHSDVSREQGAVFINRNLLTNNDMLRLSLEIERIKKYLFDFM